MSDDTERTLGRLLSSMEQFQARLSDHVAEDNLRMARIDVKLEAINETLAQAKGGWKTLVMVAGVAGTLGAIGSKLIAFGGGMLK